jgi:hypothetical protein
LKTEFRPAPPQSARRIYLQGEEHTAMPRFCASPSLLFTEVPYPERFAPTAGRQLQGADARREQAPGHGT